MRISLAPIALVTAALGLLSASPALASAPQFDKGSQIDQSAPYDTAQVIDGVFQNKEVYGKLGGVIPVDIYKFTAEQDGGEQISIMVADHPAGTDQPGLLLADPTDATTAQDVSLPLPADNYHFARITPLDNPRAYRDPITFQHYAVLADQAVTLKKGTVYYLVVLPSSSTTSNPYVIRFGTGSAWKVSDFFTHFSGWWRVQTSNYGDTSPFTFISTMLGTILLMLGLGLLIGVVFIQELYAMLANRAKAAGYLLIKMQPYSRIAIWVNVVLMAIGAFVLFDHTGWYGIPFVLTVIFIIIAANMAYVTFSLSRRVEQLEVSKREATIPFGLRKRWFFSSLVSLFSFGAFIVYFSMFITR